MGVATTATVSSKRTLIVHDGLAFVSLVAVSFALFGVTWFLFRSFESHRVDLAVRWAQRGRTALQQNHPEEAVAALRTALSYAPDNEPDQLLLAQALAGAGHTEEATNYFLNLWDARPGDGFINLQLARLARQKGERKEAVEYYRASIFGSWEGDGVLRRRAVRLELVTLLIEMQQSAQARDELFVIAGNAPVDEKLSIQIADKFAAIGDFNDALNFDEKALAANPQSLDALERAGELAFRLGDFPKSEHLIERALAQKPAPEENALLQTQLESARRFQELNLTRDQPAQQRADHILLASKIAEARLQSCSQQPSSTSAAPQLKQLTDAWTAATQGGHAHLRELLENAAAQDNWTALILRTEQTTAQVCGRPTGDDARLLILASSAANSSSPGKD